MKARLIVRCASAAELEEWHLKVKSRAKGDGSKHSESTSAYVRSFMTKALKLPLPGGLPLDGVVTAEELQVMGSRVTASGQRMNASVREVYAGQSHSVRGVELETVSLLKEVSALYERALGSASENED